MYSTLLSRYTSDTECVGFPHIRQSSDMQGIYDSILFRYYLPGVNVGSHKVGALSHKTAPNSDANCKSLLSLVFLTDQL